MKKVIKLNERDLNHIVKRVVKEQEETRGGYEYFKNKLEKIQEDYNQAMFTLQSLGILIFNTEEELYKDKSLSKEERDKLYDVMDFYTYADEKIQDFLNDLEESEYDDED
jgi:hypothetical protein